MNDLTHFDAQGQAHMVDVGGKAETRRTAVAEGWIRINTQVSAISGAVQRQTPQKPWHVEGEQNAEWILLDYVDIVVHVFQKPIREYYDIEGLWGDAKITHIKTNE